MMFIRTRKEAFEISTSSDKHRREILNDLYLNE